MIKCEVIEKFDLKDFDKLSNIKRKSIDVKGSLFVGDIFECDEDMAHYLTGNNPLNKIVVKVIEVIPEIKVEIIETAIGKVPNITFEERTKTSKKKKSSKK